MRIKKYVAIALASVMLTSVVVPTNVRIYAAETQSIGGATVVVNTDTRVVTVSGVDTVTKALMDSVCQYCESLGITEIAKLVLADATKIESTEIDEETGSSGATFASWGSEASPVYKLEEVYMPEVQIIDSTAFLEVKSLNKLEAPNLITIGTGVFLGCKKLAEVEMPKVTTIGTNSFAGCVGLKTIMLPKTTILGNYVFQGCTELQSVSLPLITVLPDNSFSNCKKLTGFDLANVTTIKDYAFTNCSALSELNLSKATSIHAEAFRGCTEVSKIVYTPVGEPAFDIATLTPSTLGVDANNVTIKTYKGSAFETAMKTLGYTNFEYMLADNEQEVSRDASTSVPVVATVEPTTFSVTVPLITAVEQLADGTVVVPTNLRVENNSPLGPIKISEITINPKGAWEMIDYDTPQTAIRVNQNVFGVAINTKKVDPTSKKATLEGTLLNAINPTESLPITLDVKLGARASALTNAELMDVVVTVGWDKAK